VYRIIISGCCNSHYTKDVIQQHLKERLGPALGQTGRKVGK
jgi:hypothetical protein